MHEAARLDETNGNAKEEGILDSGRMWGNCVGLCIVKGRRASHGRGVLEVRV